METLPIELNGDWTYKIKLPKLNSIVSKGHSSTNEQVHSDELELELCINDELSDEPDPTTEQLNTIKYIFEHQEKLLAAICKRALEEIPTVLENYDIDEDELEVYNSMDAEKIQDWIRIGHITVSKSYKDDYAYFSMNGGIKWEEEHGLSIHFHKDRIIYFGDWDDCVNEQNDGGTKRKPSDDDIKIYTPHPKYNKLKPSQVDMNEHYASTLIRRGMNERFMSDAASGIIDIKAPWGHGGSTYLECACLNHNYELIKFMLSQKLPIGRATHWCWKSGMSDRTSLEILLEAGADINFQNPQAKERTLLFIRNSVLNDHFRWFYEHKKIDRTDSMAREEKQIELIKQDIDYLIQKGADIHIKDSDGNTCFDVLEDVNAADKSALVEWMSKLHKQANKSKSSNSKKQKTEITSSSISEEKKPWWKKLFD
jgi:hypothetical protein